MPAFEITFNVTVKDPDGRTEPHLVKVPIEADDAYEAAEKLTATLAGAIRARYQIPPTFR